MLGIFWWLIVGLVAGALARLLVPGRQPMSVLWTIVLGLIGSLVGGFISSIVFGYHATDPGFHVGGLIMSTVGAIAVLGVYLMYSRRWVA